MDLKVVLLILLIVFAFAIDTEAAVVMEQRPPRNNSAQKHTTTLNSSIGGTDQRIPGQASNSTFGNNTTAVPIGNNTTPTSNNSTYGNGSWHGGSLNGTGFFLGLQQSRNGTGALSPRAPSGPVLFATGPNGTALESTTTTEETPYAFPRNRPGKGYGKTCQFYGAEFYQRQKSSADMTEKQKAVSEYMCKINLRLECVPLPGQRPPTTQAPAPGSPIKVDETASLSGQRIGRCLCARSLGDRAVYIQGVENVKTGCYIPAGFNHASLCGHQIGMPYGTIDNGTIVAKEVGDSKRLCVPNAECRVGYTYVGLRCACKKNAIWIRENGTCVMPAQGMKTGSSSSPLVILTVVAAIILHCCMSKI